MKSNKILALVVSFNGLTDTFNTIKALINQVDHIHVVDNASDQESIDILKSQVNPNITFSFLSENKGIGYALNIGILQAKLLNADWILTMDQDSIVHEDLIKEYKKTIYNNISAVCLTPAVNVYGMGEIFNRSKKNINNIYQVNYAITSGNLVKTSLFDEVGKFDEDLYIDCVDFDFTLRVRKLGYVIYLVSQAIIYHKLGDEKKVPDILSRVYTSHSPVRRYYMYRNWCYIIKRYINTYPLFIIKSTIIHILLLAIIPFYDKRPVLSLKYICYGIADFFKQKMGPFTLNTK